jgi:hypothetical protein
MGILNLGKLRIGAKLGLSAAAGVVLVVGLIVSGQFQNVNRERSAAEIKSSFEMRSAVATFELTTRRLLIANRDMRLAQDGKQVADAISRIRTLTTEGLKQIARLEELGTQPEARDQLTKVSGLYGQYVGALSEIGNSLATVMTLREEQDTLLSD